MSSRRIGFIGAGNMANALVRGLIANGWPAADVVLADPDTKKLQTLHDECGVSVAQDNHALVKQADIIVLAVKPQVCKAVVRELRHDLCGHKCLLISIIAGISLQQLSAWTHPDQAIVRCMPNTPALVQSGASGLYANANCSEQNREIAATVLAAVGTVNWLAAEQDMDAVTALSGSGPAYFFLLMEAMQEAAVKLGLEPETARDLCLQTALGAAKLALGSNADVGELRRRVTSPGGTTEAALKQFASDRFSAIVERALGKAAARSKELTQQAD